MEKFKENLKTIFNIDSDCWPRRGLFPILCKFSGVFFLGGGNVSPFPLWIRYCCKSMFLEHLVRRGEIHDAHRRVQQHFKLAAYCANVNTSVCHDVKNKPAVGIPFRAYQLSLLFREYSIQQSAYCLGSNE